MNLKIRVVKLGCPNCGGRVHIEGVILRGGTITFEGMCCQKGVTSRPLNILEYVEFPDIKEGKN